MKFLKIAVVSTLLFYACSEKKEPCDEYSEPYFSHTLINFSLIDHNTKIKGENISIRKSFKKLIEEEQDIVPVNGFITIKLHIDKFGNFCKQESFQIDENYQPTIFNNGELIKKIESITNSLKGWTNDTETKTFYLIRLKIKDGSIKEVF